MKIKNNKLVLIVSVIICAFLGIMAVNLNETKETLSNNNLKLNEKKLILIDPGHGGIDGGAVSRSGTIEKDINLNISLKLKELLQKEGFDVMMTRDEDIGLYSDVGTIRQKKIEDLNKRCKIKSESNCNMFISIHLNKFPQSNCRGAQVWYSNFQESSKFANIIQANFRKDLDANNKRKEQAAKNSYKILRCNDTIPAVIVECGFLSNAEDEEKLKSDSYQKQIASLLSKSILEYYK